MTNEKEKRFLNIWYKFYFSKLYKTENPLDNCNFVYLDMGTNFGVQIRWELVHSCSPTLLSGSCTNLISTPGPQYWKCLTNILVTSRPEIQTRLENFCLISKFCSTTEIHTWRSVLLAGSPIPSMLIISRGWERLINPVDIGSRSIPGLGWALITRELR